MNDGNQDKSAVQAGTRSTSLFWKHHGSATGFLLLVCILNYVLLPVLGYRANGFIFLICVFPVAVFFGLSPALLFASGSALVWDFFFIPPRFTFTIQTSEDAMMNITYIVVAIVSGLLGTRIRMQEIELKKRERDSNLLYELEMRLSKQNGALSIIAESTLFMDEHFGLKALLLESSAGKLSCDDARITEALDEEEIQEAQWVYRNDQRAGLGTSKFSSSRLTYLPLGGNDVPAGVMVLDGAVQVLQKDEVLMHRLCSNMGLALEREQYRVVARRNQLLEESEKLHQTLLNSVSHELRTPLTSILGAIGKLIAEAESPQREKPLLQIRESAERLNQTITNLLDMSRVRSGTLRLKRSIIDINDLIHGCASTGGVLFDSRKIEIVEGSESFFVEGDEKLLETAIVNLLGNAAKHAPQESEIKISISCSEDTVLIEVADQGPGVRAGEEEKVFEYFYTLSGGLGLGLPIVRAIMQAHEGSAKIKIHEGTGAIFQLILPRAFLPPSLSAELQKE